MGRLTTHVLDTASGKPAVGMRIELHRFQHGMWEPVVEEVRTNADGRCDAPLLGSDVLEEWFKGCYRITFFVGDYFAGLGSPDARAFLNQVPIEFTITDASAHYHVPLLVSPWAYSTYRGS